MPSFVIEALGPRTETALAGRSEIVLDAASKGDEVWITQSTGLVTKFEIQAVRHCVVATGLLGLPDREGKRYPIEERHTVLVLSIFEDDEDAAS
jgi:hypothetical protein